MTLPLRARLAASDTLLVAVLLGVVTVVSYRAFARQLDCDATARLAELTSGFHGYLRFSAGAPSFAFDARDADQQAFFEQATRYYQIYDTSTGALIVRSTALKPLGLNFTPDQVRAFRNELQPIDITTPYGRYRLSNSLVDGGSRHAQLLQIGMPLKGMDDLLARYVALLRVILPLTLLVSAVGAWWIAAIALAPLSRFAGAASTIDVASLSCRLPVRGAEDEIDEVARAFNATLARLEHAVNHMRQFSAALAHELRTPLAALRGEIELAFRSRENTDATRRALVSQLEEVDKLNRLIDQILTLARAESGQIPLSFKTVDLTALAATLVEQLEPVARARAIDLRVERSEPTFVEGDPGWLERLILNLIDNALKFTPTGGRVTLRVAREEQGGRVEVCDNGVGIAPESLARVFEPFFRAHPARSSAAAGTGLGLTLVKWIVDRHLGRIRVSSEPGRGSQFDVWLPAARVTRDRAAFAG